MIGALHRNGLDKSWASDSNGPDEAAVEAALAGKLDDRTTAYILKMRTCFDSLKQVAAQLAGLLVLAATGARSQIFELPMIDQAGIALREAEDGLRTVFIPETCRHHHHHLSLALESIGEALARAGKGSLRFDDKMVEETLQKLRAGWREMHSAANALPGFQTVDFSQACCAVHAPEKGMAALIK